MNDNKKISQKLWAQNKYLVLSKSQKIYKDIRELLKKEDIAPDEVQLLIDQAIKLEENPKEVINSLQHVYTNKYGYENCLSNYFFSSALILFIIEAFVNRQNYIQKYGIL